MSHQVLLWVAFSIFILVMLVLDLWVFQRKAHVIQLKEALLWVVFWVALALVFNLGIYFWRGPAKAIEFLAGYVIEYSLSVDNIFVFLLIFSYFRVPASYQHKVLFWGILGAIVMRAVFIAIGITLITRFSWIIYVFGVFLVLTGIKMMLQKNQEIRPEKNPLLKLLRRWMPVTEQYEGERFFTQKAGHFLATPLFVVLLVVETSDIVFAVDSIPAVLAITVDPFIVYTSNIFAVLGLRALYFALAGMMRTFHHLHYGLSIILIFVGIKMLMGDFYKMPTGIALGMIAGILLASVVASLIWPVMEPRKNN